MHGKCRIWYLSNKTAIQLFKNRNLISRLFSSCIKAFINHKWLDSLIWNISTCFLYQINISISFGSLFVHTELKQMRMSLRRRSMGSKCVRSIHIYSVTTLPVSGTRIRTGSGTVIMRKPFTLAVYGITAGHLKAIEIPHHLKEFQDLKNGYITYPSLSLFRCSVNGPT